MIYVARIGVGARDNSLVIDPKYCSRNGQRRIDGLVSAGDIGEPMLTPANVVKSHNLARAVDSDCIGDIGAWKFNGRKGPAFSKKTGLLPPRAIQEANTLT